MLFGAKLRATLFPVMFIKLINMLKQIGKQSVKHVGCSFAVCCSFSQPDFVQEALQPSLLCQCPPQGRKAR